MVDFYNEVGELMPGSPSLVGRAPGNENHKARTRKGPRVQISLPAPIIPMESLNEQFFCLKFILVIKKHGQL